MAFDTIKIMELPSATQVVEDDYLVVEQPDKTKKATVSQVISDLDLANKSSLTGPGGAGIIGTEDGEGVQKSLDTDRVNTRELWRRALHDLGLTLVDGSFEEGATLSYTTDAIWHMSGAQCYTWSGTFPKSVPAGSTPSTTGSGWITVGGLSLLDEVTEIKNEAVEAKDQAEDARNEAQAYVLQASELGNLYASVSEGLAATTNGQYFQVPQGSESSVAFKVYKNSAGIAQEVARVPGTAAITGTIREFPTLAAAQADVDAGNILSGAIAFYRSPNDSALAIEVINNGGTLEPTGRLMPSEKTINSALEKKLSKYSTQSEDENLIIITDSEGNKTWLQASLEDGMPTSQTAEIIKDTVGRSDYGHIDSGGEELLFTVPDGDGNPTALSVRKSDGMFTNAVIKDIKERLDLPSNDEEVSPDFKTYDRAPDFQLISSVARGLSRHIVGTELPAKSYTFVNSYGQGNIIKLPTGYSDATPIPLVLILDGVTSDTSDASLPPSIRSAYDVLLSNGIAMAKSRYHGNSYGSPKCMADLLELYQKACEIAPIGAVILYGNSMGGIAAQNCLLTNTIPSVSGLYLVDPTYDLYQRYTNGRQSEINSAYDCTPETYAEKTAGYDPALRHWSEYRGLPIHIRASSLDTSVLLSLHGQKLKDYLGEHNDVTLFDTQTAGHNIADRFNGEELMTFIHTKCISGKVIL